MNKILVPLLLSAASAFGQCSRYVYNPFTRQPDCVSPAMFSCTGSPVTCTLYDPTAGTGSTTLIVRAGPGQAGILLQEFLSSGAIRLFAFGADGYFGTYTGSTRHTAIGSTIMGLASNLLLQWGNDPNWGAGVPDLGISRTSNGLAEFNSGTAGKWAGLKLGTVQMQSLATPGAPAVVPTCGSGCTQTWTYKAVAKLGDGKTTEASATGSTALQNATLGATNYNTITPAAVTGSTSCDVYRTVSGGTPASLGKIGNVACGAALVDNGLAGDASTAPTGNDTGLVLTAIRTPSVANLTCTAGGLWTDASYIYVCTASGAIKRAGIAGW